MKVNLPRTFSLLSRFNECNRVDDICRVTLHDAAQFGVDFVLVGIIPDKNIAPVEQLKHVIFGSVPEEWRNRYFENNYLELDPTIQHLRMNDHQLAWGNLKECNSGAGNNLVMDEARDFRMRDGITIPHFSLDGVKIGASFSGERLQISAESTTYLTVLSALAITRALTICKGQQAHPLSPREKECLLWVAEGKSDWDISAILGISQKTVEKHLSNCRRKLNSVNRSQAVARAIQFGIIT